MDSVTVFCGSRPGAKPEFAAATAELGAALARAGVRIVYGGGSRGLMGVLAEAALAEGGEVIGIIPRFLEAREVAHRGLTELVIVDSMQHRKDRLIAAGDAVIVLPGGFGTMDELLEVLTMKLLGVHAKPILICNVAGWADALLAAFEAAIEADFAVRDVRRAWEIVPDTAHAVRWLARVGQAPR